MKNEKKQKQTAKTTARPKPFLTPQEVEELQYLPKGIWEVLNASHGMVNNMELNSDAMFRDLWTMIAFSWLWCDVYDDASRNKLYVFLSDLMNIVDKSKKHIDALDGLDYEEMDVYYLVP